MPRPRPHHLDDTARRRIRRRRQRARNYRASLDWRCEACGARHGTLTPVGENACHRVEVVIVHRNGNRADWRWKNLRAVCRDCLRKDSGPFTAAQASHPNGEAR